MAIKGFHLKSCHDDLRDNAIWRLSLPVVPTLLGALAVLNVTSVVMVLME